MLLSLPSSPLLMSNYRVVLLLMLEVIYNHAMLPNIDFLICGGRPKMYNTWWQLAAVVVVAVAVVPQDQGGRRHKSVKFIIRRRRRKMWIKIFFHIFVGFIATFRRH